MTVQFRAHRMPPPSAAGGGGGGGGGSSGTFPDASSFMSDAFDTGDLTKTNSEGFSWEGFNVTSIVKQTGAGNILVNDGTQQNVTIADGRNWTDIRGQGFNCLRFRYPAGGPSFPEQRYAFGTTHVELWMRWWMRVPTSFAVDSANDKFCVFWNDTYETGNGSTVYLSHWPNGSSPSTTRDIAYAYSPGNGSGSGGYAGNTPYFTTSDAGRWMQNCWHVKSETSSGAGNGVVQFYRRWQGESSMTQLINASGLAIRVGTSGTPGFAHGYLMGSNENGFYSTLQEFLWSQIEWSTSSLVV